MRCSQCKDKMNNSWVVCYDCHHDSVIKDKQESWNDGYDQGRKEGYNQGFDAGYEQCRQEIQRGINNIVGEYYDSIGN